jgi:thiamine pyrophosphate-dependent acetolactate synthase large subunit-like protein
MAGERSGIQMAYGAIAQAWEASSPMLVLAEGVGTGGSRHNHFNIAEALRPVTKWVGEVDRADLVPDYMRRAFTQLRSGRPGPVLLVVPKDLGEYDEAQYPYTPVKGWRTSPDPDDVKAAVKALLAAKDRCSTSGRASTTPTPPRSCCSSPGAANMPVLTTR